jgi:hypothetical protein
MADCRYLVNFMSMLQLADYFFLVFHSFLILFNLFGWLYRRTMKLHLAIILLTFASWFILGIWYGWGYCPLTDWHWSVLRNLGHNNLPPSYIGYLLNRIFGLEIRDLWVDVLTVGLALIALLCSVWVNFFRKNNSVS